MRITKISISKLFGLFDHCIPVNLDTQLTIIHGPNGFGKTAILRILYSLFNSSYSEIQKIPFEEFRVDFEDGTKILLNKSLSKEEGGTDVTLTFNRPGLQLEPFFLNRADSARKEVSRKSIARLERMLPGLNRIDSDSWVYASTRETLSLEQVIERFSDRLPIGFLDEVSLEPKEWLKFQRDFKIYFIRTDRLLATKLRKVNRTAQTYYATQTYYDSESSTTSTVSKYSEEITQSIRGKLTEYAALSQSLDRTFPSRLLEQDRVEEPDVEEIRKRLNEFESKYLRLTETGLLDKEKDIDFQAFIGTDKHERDILSVYARVLAVYAKDIEEKLSVFDEILSKIELFKKIINSRFTYKSMSIDKRKGFIFKTSNGKPFPAKDLSSGEQHELVLIYELLFRVKPQSLILIDEPELSLHVGWQIQFLSDLKEIIELINLDFLIATHSPQIINNRWDLTVELQGSSDE